MSFARAAQCPETMLGRRERACVVCGKSGMAPELLPYLGKQGHVWEHQACAEQAYAKRETA